MNIVVSIIIPVYNTKVGYFKQCIESILNQTYEYYEILIVDDCSTNADILHYLDFLSSKNNVRVMHLPCNAGIAGARNIGIQNAEGQVICFVDHDDFWEQSYLAEMVDAFNSENTEMVVTGYKLVNEENQLLNCVPRSKEFVKSPYWIYSSSAPWNRLISKNFLLDNDITFPTGCLTEDIVFNINCNIKANNPIGISESGYCNRVNTQSTSRSNRFVSMKYEEMPFAYIEDICKIIDTINNRKQKAIYESAITNELTLLVCVFSRESDKKTKKRARQVGSELIRKYMSHYVKNAVFYNRNMPELRLAMKMIHIGYMVAVSIHLEGIYCRVVHTILRLYM